MRVSSGRSKYIACVNHRDDDNIIIESPFRHFHGRRVVELVGEEEGVKPNAPLDVMHFKALQVLVSYLAT